MVETSHSMIKAYWWSDDKRNEREIISSAVSAYLMKKRSKGAKTRKNNNEKKLRRLTVDQARQLDEKAETICIMHQYIEELKAKNEITDGVTNIGVREKKVMT